MIVQLVATKMRRIFLLPGRIFDHLRAWYRADTAKLDAAGLCQSCGENRRQPHSDVCAECLMW